MRSNRSMMQQAKQQSLPPAEEGDIWFYITKKQRLVFCLLLAQRLWPRLIGLVLVAFVFSSYAWLGGFSLLPLWLHGLVLATFGMVIAVMLARFRHLHWPHPTEINRHIEQQNGLSSQPLLVQFDEPVHADAAGLALWHAHRQRMRTLLRNLKIGLPTAQIPQRDPHGLRALVFLGFAVAFAYSFSPNAGRIGDAFTFHFSPVAVQQMRIDAWINPPEYTGLAPIYLGSDITQMKEEQRTVAHGSVAHFRLVNAPDGTGLWQINEAGKRSALTAQESSSHDTIRTYQLPLTQDMHLQLSTPGGEKNWFFTITPDRPPHIDWAGEPRRALNGMLELSYQVEDDYGVVEAWASIKALDLSEKAEIQPLMDAPQIALLLPRTLKGKASTRYDFTNHPWAGIEVEIILQARDGAGNLATTAPLILTLPQRVFTNPLARAIVEQRRLLMQDRHNRDLVSDMLAALLLRPDDTIRNATHAIALQSAWTRLSYARDDEDLQAMTNYLWQIALGIEDSGLKDAEERLKQAQQALREALRHGASAQEIERLMQELRQAMRDYIAALAERDANNPFSGERGEMQLLQQDALEQRLQQLEEMAQLGNRGAAEQLLNELEDLLANLQVVQGQNGQGDSNRGDRSAMQQNMDALADMMRRQQELMNETDRLTQERRRGEHSDDDYTRMMEGLSERQETLRGEWESLQGGLQQQGMESGEAMDEAGEAMGQARDMLGQGEGEGARGNQGRALEAMRRAGQGMMQAMREAEQGGGDSSGASLDPLGRARQGNQLSQDSDVQLPGEIDIERARRILDEIRARLQYMAPQLERHYLERLLNLD